MKIFNAMMVLLAFIAVISTASADKQTYIVRMDKTKITNTYKSLANSKSWHQAILDSLVDVSSQQEEQELEATPPELVYSYETAFFGFAAKLSAKQLESLKKIDGFVSAIPDKMLSLHTTRSTQFLGLQGSKGLWHSSNVLQSDVIIGVVDGGIWPEHVSFQDHGMPPVPARWRGSCEKGSKFSPSNCNKKLIGARSFYGGYLAAGGTINETEEYLSARDADGHGTHTASTAAGDIVEHANLFGLANGSAAGMRYTARIAVYKVCWPGCTTVDILTAIVQAIEDGVDVLSLSLGSRSEAEPYYQDYLAIASFLAFRTGIFVTFSAGNSGPQAYTAVNTAPWIMTVAASTMDRSFPTTVKLGNGQTFEGSSFYTGKAIKQSPIVYGKTAGGQGAQYCITGSLNPKLVKGKIVICEQGLIDLAPKGEQVKLAGGVGMIIVSIVGEDLSTEVHILPATLLGASASKSIKKYVNSTKAPTASIAFKGTTYGDRAPKVAVFSSRGPNLVGPDVIKPDVTAPGVDILAAWPAETSPSGLKSDKRRVLFNMISGTSMACPHVSGIAALLKSKHKNWSPSAIKSALMTTAYTIDNRGKPIVDLALYGSATPFGLGSGHVDPVKASNPGLIYDITVEDYIFYLCSLKYSASQISMFEQGFRCPKKPTMQPGDLNYPSFAVNFKGKAQNITVSYERTVKNVGISRSTYKVSVEEPKEVSVIVKPNILRFKKLGETLSYKVSFVGQNKIELSAEEEEEHEYEPASPELIYVFKTAISGFAAKLSKLGKGLWNASNLKSDVIIGVMDSGIWPEHVNFQDEGIVFSQGYEAAGGEIRDADYISARDSQGHGTHTASIAAGSLVAIASIFGLAKGSAGGVRYTSKIAAYKVCWSTQVCVSSDILAAIDQAILDGVDVLSISLGGSAKPYHNDKMVIGAFQAIKKGIFVSCSSGNSGPSSSTVSNTAPWIMTVAASYLDRKFPTTVKLGDGQNFEGSSLYVGRATKQLPLVYGKTAGDAFCTDGSLNRNLVKGKIVVCKQGIYSQAEKGVQVKLAGGAGMIIINTENEGEGLYADAHILPATLLGALAGKAIKKYLNSTKTPTASITFKGTVYGKPAPVMAAFSSRGPNVVGPDLLKPDVTAAPGMNILVAWPPLPSPTELTSDKSSVPFNSALKTTAYVLENTHRGIEDAVFSNSTLATPFAFGSGHVDPEKASDPR
ncbi:hypothetical protein REPUB_Repub17cG0167900 [Reevesia pubescens]